MYALRRAAALTAGAAAFIAGVFPHP